MNRGTDARGARRDRNTNRIARRIRGHRGPIAFLAVAGLLGIVSGFALADPQVTPREAELPCGTGTEQRINNPNNGATSTVTVGGGATLTFVFSGEGGEAYTATWTASAPFTGYITVKAGNEESGGGETTFTYSNALSGTISSPFTFVNNAGKTRTHAISHVDICGTGTASSTSSTIDTTVFTTSNSTVTTSVPTTVTITGPPTSTTTTLPDETVSTTLPDTTTTTTLPDETTTTTLPDETTTTTGPGTTVTTTAECPQSLSVSPRSLTTITVTGSTETITLPGSTVISTQPGSTNTITEPGQTITTTFPGNTDTITEPGNTVTSTQAGQTIVSTVPGETSTVTDCTTSTSETTSTEGTTTTAGTTTATGATAGTVETGGIGGVAGSKKASKKDPTNESVAAAATEASGGLPFTGLHVPALILVGLLMAAAGLVLRRTVRSLE